MARQGVALPPLGQYGVGMVFLPHEPASRLACEYEIERAIKDEGQVLLGWRDVPVDNADLGESVKRIEPVIRQVFIGRGPDVTVTDALERKLYIIRKASGHAIQALQLAHGKEFYVPSMSARTIVYKGMLLRLAGRHLLQGPAGSARRVGAGAGPSALLDQHVPDLGSRASVPADRPQRRDQHGARQRELDPRAPGRDLEPDPRRGSRQGLAADLRRPVRLGVVRQRARAAGHERLLDRARDDDDDPGGVGEPYRRWTRAGAPSTSTTRR